VTTHDDDILDFDFFDEGATRESPPREQQGRRPPAGGGPRGPRLRGGLTPLLRLVGLIAFAILVVVLIVVWGQGCASDRKRNSYDDYMSGIGAVGEDSEKIGGELAELLTTPGLKQADLETQLGGLIQRQRIGVTRADELDPPGPVHPQHEQALEALQFRVSGMQGLLSTFQATKASKDAGPAGEQLSVQAQRLVTSDVVWEDLFRGPAERVLADRGIDGVTVPDSNFVENAELYTARSLSAIWQRVHGASTGGTPSGAHGNGLSFVRAQPSAQQLSTTTETTIQLSTELAFEVGVTNSGDFQEVSVEVALTIPQQPAPIVKKATIDLIDPGETKTVTFRDFGAVTPGEPVKLQVAVKPVPGETNKGNNSAEYPVIFSLAAP
jgi:CARDB protein